MSTKRQISVNEDASGNIQITQPEQPPDLRLSPMAAALAGAGAGNVDNGAHAYLVVLVTAAGETGFKGEDFGAVTVTVADKAANGQVALSGIPTGSPFVTARKIYRTKAGADPDLLTNYKLLATVANNTATTYTDNTADSGLGTGTPAKTNTTANPVFSYNHTTGQATEGVGGGGGGGSTPVSKTVAQMQALVGSFVPGTFYLITDAPDTSQILIQAVDANRLSKEGTRLMLCPADYKVETDGNGNNWIGVWNQSKGTYNYGTLVGSFVVGELITGGTSGKTARVVTDDGTKLTLRSANGPFVDGETITGSTSAATAVLDFTTKPITVGQLAIWGGKVWRNVNGLIGLATNDAALNAEWTLITKAAFSNSEYVLMTFGCSYDLANNWIEKQWDGVGNIFGLDHAASVAINLPFNYCDISDWNYATSGFRFYGNRCSGLYNNSPTGGIFRNRVNTKLIRNSNLGHILDNFVGGDLKNNSNAGSILDNFISVDILDNSNNGVIFSCKCYSVENNDNLGYIRKCIAGGSVINCSSTTNPCNISEVVTNASITGVFAADVSGLMGVTPVADGVYPAPASITVVNGIITAVT